ncbi:MAG: hypothetical protein AAF633_18965 [Chloroflexota bacterium]
MQRVTYLIAAAMILTAAAGTVWYILIELETKGSVSAVGWSVIAVIWFVIVRRLIHLARNRDRS